MEKSIFVKTLALGVLAMGLQVSAQETPVDNSVEDVVYDYQCSGAENKLIYVMNDVVKDGVQQAFVKVGEPRNYHHYDATMTSTNSPLYKIDTYQLFENEIKVGELKISTHQFIGRGGCGRAGCDHQINQIQGLLKLGEYEAIFDCH